MNDQIDEIEQTDDRRHRDNGAAAMMLGACVIALCALLAFLAFLWWHPQASCCCCQPHNTPAVSSTTTLGQTHVYIPPGTPAAHVASHAEPASPAASEARTGPLPSVQADHVASVDPVPIVSSEPEQIAEVNTVPFLPLPSMPVIIVERDRHNQDHPVNVPEPSSWLMFALGSASIVGVHALRRAA